MPKYARPPFPPKLYARFVKLADTYGFGKRGRRWELMEKMIVRAEMEPWDYEEVEGK